MKQWRGEKITEQTSLAVREISKWSRNERILCEISAQIKMWHRLNRHSWSRKLADKTIHNAIANRNSYSRRERDAHNDGGKLHEL